MSRDRVLDESYDAKTERYVRSLEDRVGYLRDERDREREANLENSLIIAGLEERISKLEASQMSAVEQEKREPHLPTVGPDDPDQEGGHPQVHKVPEDLKNEAVWAQFFITAGASIVAAAVLVMSVLNGQVVLAGLAGGLTLLSIVSFLSHWLLFRSNTDRMQVRPSEPRSEASASRQEESRQDRLVAKKLPLPLDFLLQLLVCLALAFGVVKPFVVEPFYIPSESMVPTLKVGDRVLVNKFIYRFSEPQRGDIVVFNGQRQNEPYVVNKPCVRGMPRTCSYGPVTVPKGDYFVMGDNRAKSADSRFIGPVPKKAIVGEAFLRLWPPSRVGLLDEPAGWLELARA
jgi:signal peptidase I